MGKPLKPPEADYTGNFNLEMKLRRTANRSAQ